MKKIGKKITSFLKISGLAFTIISGSAFAGAGFGMIFHAGQREKAQNLDGSQIQSIKTEQNFGLGLAMVGSFIGLGKFYLTFGINNLSGIGPTSKKLAQKIKKIYKNDIKEQ